MFKYIRLIIVFGVIASCSEDRLQLSPISLNSAGNFYSTPEQIEQAVVAVYDGLQFNGQYRQDFIYTMEVRSDNSRQESTTASGGIYADIDLFRIETNNAAMDEIWKDCYKGIQRCNILLNRIDAVGGNPNKNVQIGEAKFIRALTYFNLVRTFGDVPLVTIEFDDAFDAFKIGRTATSEVYVQIIQDLTDAGQLLESTPIRIGGATKGAAYTLLGKVHLTLGNYSEAITELEKVSGYTLLPNYTDVFGIENENNDESIFEVQFTKGGINEGSPYANLFAPFGATELTNGIGATLGTNLPTQDLYDSFEVGDLRKEASIGTASTGTFYTKKYVDIPSSDRDGDNNFIVLRYADVLLMKAEALNEQEYLPDGESFNLLNQIRNRAGKGDLTSTELPDQESFRNAIANERRWELAFENHRWFDLVRTGKAVEVMNAHASATGGLEIITTDNYIYPIPQSQIDATNGDITQNTGY